MVPLNSTAERIFELLCGDETTGRWLFAKDGKVYQVNQKGLRRSMRPRGN